jgi:hypothetical protein
MSKMKELFQLMAFSGVVLAASCTQPPLFFPACEPMRQKVEVHFLEEGSYGKKETGRLVDWNQDWISLESGGRIHHYPTSNIEYVQESKL